MRLFLFFTIFPLEHSNLFNIFMTETVRFANYDRITFMKKNTRKPLRAFITCIIIAAAFTLIINVMVVKTADPLIVSTQEAYDLSAAEGRFDCILVLGASVSEYGPSPILANRLDMGLELFNMGLSDIVLLSGDNGTIEYNEVQAMKDYALKHGNSFGLNAANVYLDYAGFSTYYSAVRCKEIFGANRVVIVTQRYHLYRAVFIAKMIGLDVIGVAAEDMSPGQAGRSLREVPARLKDFFLTTFNYTPSIMGDPVPLVYPSTQSY